MIMPMTGGTGDGSKAGWRLMTLAQEDLALLRKVPLFSRLSDQELASLLKGAVPREYARGVLLFQQGDRADCFYVILEGLVKITRHSPDGDEVVIGVFGKGSMIAEIAMFLGGRYPATAEVVAPSRLLPVLSSSFKAALTSDPDLAMGMLAATSRRVRDLVEELEHIKGQTGAQRVADFIVGLCPQQEGEAQIDLPYEKGLIAARLGMKPESFSRALKRLRQLGVQIQRDHVIIRDVAALNHFAMTGEFLPVGPATGKSSGS